MRKKAKIIVCTIMMILSVSSVALAAVAVYAPTISLTYNLYHLHSSQTVACAHELELTLFETNTTTHVSSSKDLYGSASSQKEYDFTMYPSTNCRLYKAEGTYRVTPPNELTASYPADA